MNNIGLKLYEPFLKKPLSFSRENALEELKDFDFNAEKLIVVDGSKFSDEIKILKDDEINNSEKILLLDPGIDGVIAETKQKIELALPVGDCGLLVTHHKDLKNSSKILANSHLGYKGVIANGDLEKNGIIENFISSLKNIGNTENLNDFEFFLAPLAGDNFELTKEYFDSKIRPFIEKQNKFIKENYKKNPDNFITKSENIGENGEEKIYFLLKDLILYILENRYFINLKKENIHSDSTTNPKNTFSSFRSHTLANGIPEKAFLDEKNQKSILNLLKNKNNFSLKEINFIQSVYGINREQALILLNGNAGFYKNNNSRLSLNIFTK